LNFHVFIHSLFLALSNLLKIIAWKEVAMVQFQDIVSCLKFFMSIFWNTLWMNKNFKFGYVNVILSIYKKQIINKLLTNY